MSTTTLKAGFKRLPLTADGKLIERSYQLKCPRNQVIISFPKTGKTDNMVGVKNFLIGDCEKGTRHFEGTNRVNLVRYFGKEAIVKLKSGAFIYAGIYEIVKELYRANRMEEFNLLIDQLEDDFTGEVYGKIVKLINEIPFPIFAIDPLTSFMPLIYSTALAEYNEDVSEDKKKMDIKRVDKYGGTRFIRQALLDTKAYIEEFAAPFIIYTGHCKLTKSVIEKDDHELGTVDLNLEGQLATIFTAHAEAVAILHRNKDGVFLDYSKKGDSDTAGRPRHLGGRVIKIADLHTYAEDDNEEQYLKEKGKTYWQKIYPELTF